AIPLHADRHIRHTPRDDQLRVSLHGARHRIRAWRPGRRACPRRIRILDAGLWNYHRDELCDGSAGWVGSEAAAAPVADEPWHHPTCRRDCFLMPRDGVTDLEKVFIFRNPLKPELPIAPSGADCRCDEWSIRPCAVAELEST